MHTRTTTARRYIYKPLHLRAVSAEYYPSSIEICSARDPIIDRSPYERHNPPPARRVEDVRYSRFMRRSRDPISIGLNAVPFNRQPSTQHTTFILLSESRGIFFQIFRCLLKSSPKNIQTRRRGLTSGLLLRNYVK